MGRDNTQNNTKAQTHNMGSKTYEAKQNKHKTSKFKKHKIIN